jgi:hypothetical protein
MEIPIPPCWRKKRAKRPCYLKVPVQIYVFVWYLWQMTKDYNKLTREAAFPFL